MLWTVANEIGADGLPADRWAGRARQLLNALPQVRAAEVTATVDHEWDDEPPVAGLSISVAIEGSDPETVAALVEQILMSALFDVVGDEEVGWTAQTWTARPFA